MCPDDEVPRVDWKRGTKQSEGALLLYIVLLHTLHLIMAGFFFFLSFHFIASTLLWWPGDGYGGESGQYGCIIFRINVNVCVFMNNAVAVVVVVVVFDTLLAVDTLHRLIICLE